MSVLRRNILWMLVSQGLTWMMTVVLLVLGPKRLDADGYGKWMFAVSYVTLFVLIGGLGTSTYVAKQVARDHAALEPLVKSTLQLKALLAVSLSITALGLVWLWGYRGDSLTLVGIGCVGLALQLLNEGVVAGLAGLEHLARPAMWQTVQVYVGSLLGVLVLVTTQSLLLFAATPAFAWLIVLIANSIELRSVLRQPRPRPTVSRVPWRTIIVGGAPLMVLALLTTIYGTIDVPLLDKIAGSEVVGWYTVAYKWVSMPIFITTIVGIAFFPQMSAAATRAIEELAALANRALRLVLVVTIPASIGLILVAGDLLHFIYGHQYDNSISLVQILSLHIPLAAMDTILASTLIAADRQNRYLLVALAAAILNPPLVILAIHVADNRYGNAAIGAAIVTVLTELFIMVCALHLRPRGVLDRYTVQFAARCVIAAGFMAGALFLLGGAGLFVRVAVGGATYAIASVALGIVSVSRVKALVTDLRGGRISALDGGRHAMTQTGVDL